MAFESSDQSQRIMADKLAIFDSVKSGDLTMKENEITVNKFI